MASVDKSRKAATAAWAHGDAKKGPQPLESTKIEVRVPPRTGGLSPLPSPSALIPTVTLALTLALAFTLSLALALTLTLALALTLALIHTHILALTLIQVLVSLLADRCLGLEWATQQAQAELSVATEAVSKLRGQVVAADTVNEHALQEVHEKARQERSRLVHAALSSMQQLR